MDATPGPRRSFALRLLRPPLYLVAAVVILIEDWLWEPLGRLAAMLGHLPVLRRLEAVIARLPPRAAVALFLVPTVVLFPFKLLAVAAFARGMYTLGVGLALGAKVVGTALVARIFTLCKPTLLGVPWFARLHAWFVAFKARILGYLRETAAWRRVKAFSAAVRARFASARAGVLTGLWRKAVARARRN